jgi:integrase
MQRIPNVREVAGAFVFRRKVPADLVQRLGRFEIVRSLKTHSRAVARRRSRRLWVQTEEIFALLQQNPTIMATQAAQMVDVVKADIEWADLVRLAANRGAHFDHHGDAPPDADAAVLEAHAHEFREAAAAYDIDGVSDRIQILASKIGINIAPGSVDERIIGNLILNEYARSCEDSANVLRASSGSHTNMVTDASAGIATLVRFIEVATEKLATIGSLGNANSANTESASGIPATDTRSTADDQTPVSEISKIAEKLSKSQVADKRWDKKSQRGAQSIANLLVKYLQQELRLSHLSEVGQAHLAKFTDFLRYDIYRYYGRSWKDKGRTIAELRANALLTRKVRRQGKLVEIQKERGIVAETLNKHVTFLNQIFDHGVNRGVAINDKIDLPKLRAKAKNKARARNARPKLALEAFMPVFDASHYKNVLAWDALDKDGIEGEHLVFHCALYWVPLLIYYTGFRREEVCGAMIKDVITDNGIAYLHVELNDQRRIKNEQSIRNIPLHPEILRLGFLEYLKKLKALGHTLIFPDLYSPSSGQPLGNKFYKMFKPILVRCGLTEEGLALHAIRHLFGALQKKRGTTEEERADLLGHGGGSETSERYCEPTEVEVLHTLILKMPVITGHVEKRPINLIPWVANKDVAPFSHPSRSKKTAK